MIQVSKEFLSAAKKAAQKLKETGDKSIDLSNKLFCVTSEKDDTKIMLQELPGGMFLYQKPFFGRKSI